MRRIAIAVLALLLMSLQASTSFASGLHFKNGALPTFTLTDPGSATTTVQSTGQVAGAGTGPVFVSLTATGTQAVSCFNPGNDAGPVPGQNQTVTTSGSEEIFPNKSGNATFDVTTSPAPDPSSAACPNSKWTATGGAVTYSSATLTIKSSNGGTLTCTYDFTTNTESCS